jgi:hypothetical protein
MTSIGDVLPESLSCFYDECSPSKCLLPKTALAGQKSLEPTAAPAAEASRSTIITTRSSQPGHASCDPVMSLANAIEMPSVSGSRLLLLAVPLFLIAP